MEQLNKNQLDKMTLEDQIKYINNELMKEGSSITGVCKAIGIGRSTVRERFKKLGFVFDKGSNQYIKIDKSPGIIQTTTPTATNKSEDQDTKIQELTKGNNSGVAFNNSDVVHFDNGIVMTEDQEINGQKMGYILSKFDTLEEMIRTFEAKKESVGLGDQDIVIDLIDDRHLDPKPRSFRVNAFVLNDWDQFCNENRYYQKMDLVSMALKEYIERHKK